MARPKTAGTGLARPAAARPQKPVTQKAERVSLPKSNKRHREKEDDGDDTAEDDDVEESPKKLARRHKSGVVARREALKLMKYSSGNPLPQVLIKQITRETTDEYLQNEGKRSKLTGIRFSRKSRELLADKVLSDLLRVLRNVSRSMLEKEDKTATASMMATAYANVTDSQIFLDVKNGDVHCDIEDIDGEYNVRAVSGRDALVQQWKKVGLYSQRRSDEKKRKSTHKREAAADV